MMCLVYRLCILRGMIVKYLRSFYVLKINLAHILKLFAALPHYYQKSKM